MRALGQNLQHWVKWTMDIDILVHSATNTWCATLEALLDPNTNQPVVKFHWNTEFHFF